MPGAERHPAVPNQAGPGDIKTLAVASDTFGHRIGFASSRALHDLRHAHATHLLRSGVHPKVVARERLWHGKIGITLDLYFPRPAGMEADAAERVDAALQAAINRRTKTIGQPSGSESRLRKSNCLSS
jgi:integrase